MNMFETDFLSIIRDRANKSVNLLNLMNETFSTCKDENLILVLMATIQDTYNQGYGDAEHKYNPNPQKA